MHKFLLAGLVLFIGTAACTRQPATVSMSRASITGSDCVTARSQLRVHVQPNRVVDGTVIGRVVRLNSREPDDGAEIRLSGDSVRTVPTDVAGWFRLDSVQGGTYQLRVRSIGYSELNEELSMPRQGGIELKVELALAPDPWKCENERRLASAPPLALLRPDSVTVEQSLANGGRFRHTLVAVPAGRSVRFHSRLVNSGSVVVDVVVLCSPTVRAQAVISLSGVSTCYGTDRRIAPGDSIAVTVSSPVGGAPGRYTFEVFPVEPTVMGASIELDLAAWRQPR